MSSPIGKGGRALVLRLVLAEVLARRGEGPLAPRFKLRQGRERPLPGPLPEGTGTTPEGRT